MRFLRFLTSVLVILLILQGCSGGGGGGDATIKRGISGIVTDGPVKESHIFLLYNISGEVAERCGASGTGRCETVSNSDGKFWFDITPGVSLDGLTAVARGGRDTETGVDFSGIEMRAPLSLYKGREHQVVISPLTSLVSARNDVGGNLRTSVEEILALLPTLTFKDLLSPPSENTNVHRFSLFLTALALEMQDQIYPPDTWGPFCQVGRNLPPQPLSETPGVLPPEPLISLGLDAAAQLNLTELYEILFAETTDLSRTFAIELLFQSVREILAELTSSPDTFNPEDLVFIQNAHTLAEKIWTAAGPGLVPLGGVVPRRLASYVLWSYSLASFDAFLQSPEIFLSRLVRPSDEQLLETDPEIAKLAAVTAKYCVEVPLTPAELPGNDHLKRAAYYFNSDASNLYKAEQILLSAQDDEISDPILVEIARRKGEYGLLEEARTLIDTGIFQPHYKADAYWKLGRVYLAYGLTEEALALFSLSEELNIFVIASKGIASIDKDDVKRLEYLALAYHRAGSLEGAQRVLAVMMEALPYLGTVVAYGRVVVPLLEIVDTYLEQGDRESASEVLDTLLVIARQTPPNILESGGLTYSFYQGRIYYLTETARRYADLGMTDRVQEIYNVIKSLRNDDGLQNLTENETWYYATLLVEILYSAGLREEAYSLAVTIPATYYNYAGSLRNNTIFQKRAFKSIAADETLKSGLSAGLSFIDANLPDTKDKIEALTYYSTNMRVPFVALALINDGQTSVAVDALTLATDLVDTLDYTKDRDIQLNKIRLGYIKIANLYALMGDASGAQAVLVKAEGATGGMTLSTYRVDALLEIAMAYDAAGDVASAVTFLNAASIDVQALLPTLSDEEGFYLLKDVANAALTLGDENLSLQMIDLCRTTAGRIFDGNLSYPGSDHDVLATDETEMLIETARLYLRAGDRDTAVDTLLEASDVADQIWVETTRLERYINDKEKPHIVGALAEAGAFELALETARSLPYVYDRNLALQSIALVHALQDDFPLEEFADIDTDHDGKPDFFNPLATSQEIIQTGLELDADSDGDGIPDSADLRPLYPDSAPWLF